MEVTAQLGGGELRAGADTWDAVVLVGEVGAEAGTMGVERGGGMAVRVLSQTVGGGWSSLGWSGWWRWVYNLRVVVLWAEPAHLSAIPSTSHLSSLLRGRRMKGSLNCPHLLSRYL